MRKAFACVTAAALLMALVASGCSTNARVRPNDGVTLGTEGKPTGPEDLPKPEGTDQPGGKANVVFFRDMLKKPNATYGDGYRYAFILLSYRQGDANRAKIPLTGQQALVEIQRAGLVSASWSEDPDVLLTHESAAYLMARAMDMNGGAIWSIIGTSRYAHREMVDRGLFPRENPRQYLTGAQLAAAFNDCKKYMETQ